MHELLEAGPGLEVSYDHSPLWSKRGGGSYGPQDSLPGPSSHCGPFPYLPGAGAEPGGSAGAPAGVGLTAEASRGFHASPSSFQTAFIDLSDDLSPSQLDQGQGPLQGLDLGAQKTGKVPRKRECVCSFCGKAFSSPANLESHVRAHTGERPYGCHICGKMFSQFWNLKIHQNIHTGERPYQCLLCPKRFSDPSNLKKHQKRHHPLTEAVVARATQK